MSSPSTSPGMKPVEYHARDGRSISAQRGTFSVPMRRSRADAGRVDLAFVRLPAVERARARNAILFLTGGPGLSGIAAGRGRLFDLFDALRTAGDVILLDQRGCGESAPSIACDDALRIPMDHAITREGFTAAGIDAMRACASGLAGRGIDLAGFNAAESADDVADLIRALGYRRAGLLGWSYGSHLAMAVMRRHPELVERAVLAGPEGPDQTWKLPSRVHRQLDRLSSRANFDAARVVGDTLSRVDAEPVRVAWPGGTGVAVIGRFDVEWVLAEALSDTRALKRLPAVLTRMAAGDFSVLADDPLLRALMEELRGGLFVSPLRYCADCASGASSERLARIETEARALPLGRTIDWPFPEICAAFEHPDLGDGFRAPLRSDVPVLFVTGTLDCRTPVENADDLASGLTGAHRLVVEDAGHGDLLVPRAVGDAVTRFFRDGEAVTQRVASDIPFVPDPAPATLIYDGECAFCIRQVERLRRRAGDRIVFVPFQSAGAHFGGIDRKELARAVHLVGADGTVVSGAAAVLRAASSGSALARLCAAAYRRVPGFRPLAEAVYRLIARHRGRLGG